MISNILKYVDTLLQLSGRPGRRHKLWFKTVFAPKTLIVGCIREEKERVAAQMKLRPSRRQGKTENGFSGFRHRRLPSAALGSRVN
jgi:hypothetical protein